MLALAVLAKRGEGADEALMPSFAFPADAQAAVWNGLRPVFVDVTPDHWHLDPHALRSALDERGKRVSAVVALSAFGVPPPAAVRRSWEAACSEAGVPLVIDSAAGYGARADDGLPVGAQGDAEVVSFDAVKPLCAGEGGAIFFRDEGAAEEARRLTHFAFDEAHQVTRADGLNAMMSELAAAVALAGLDELDAVLESRRAAAVELLELLPPGFTRQLGDLRGTWQFVPVAAPDPATRAAVLEASTGHVELRTYYEPLHRMAPLAGCAQAGDLQATGYLASRMLNLPMAPDLTDDEIQAVAARLSVTSASSELVA